MPKAYSYEYDEMGLDFQPKSMTRCQSVDARSICRSIWIDGKFFYGTVRYGTAGGRKLRVTSTVATSNPYE